MKKEPKQDLDKTNNNNILHVVWIKDLNRISKNKQQ